MEETTEHLELERVVRGVTIRVIARKEETPKQLYDRLVSTCYTIEQNSRVRSAVSKIEVHFKLTETDSLVKTGISSGYHRVAISLLKHFDECMGATEIAEEWGGMNTGNVSRVFTGSRKSTEKYIGHFEECNDGKYHFTKTGLEFALKEGIPEILGRK